MSREVVSPIHFDWVYGRSCADSNRPLFSAKRAVQSAAVRSLARCNGFRVAMCAEDDAGVWRAVAGLIGWRLRETKGVPFAGDQMCRMSLHPFVATEA